MHIFKIRVIEYLVKMGVIVICAGDGGIPTVYRHDGNLIGVEAVIDKDRAGALLAQELKADVYLMLTLQLSPVNFRTDLSVSSIA